MQLSNACTAILQQLESVVQQITESDFFKKHPITDFSIAHTGSSKGGLQFAIGRYVSSQENYTVLLRVKEVQGTFLVHEINFVKE